MIARHAFTTLSTRVVTTILMLLQSALFTRMLGPEGRGVFAKLQATQNLFILLFGLGVTAGIVHFLASKKASSDFLMGLTFWLWIFNLAVGLLTLFIVHLFPSTDLIFPAGYQTAFFMTYFLLSFLQSQIQVTLQAFISGSHQFSHLNRLEFYVTLLRLVLVTIFFTTQWGNENLILLFSLDLSIHTLKTLYAVFLCRSQLKLKFHIGTVTYTNAKSVVVYSWLIYLAYVINFLYQRIDIWVVERYSGLHTLGVYSVAVGLAQYLTFLPMTLNTVLLPHLSQMNHDDANKSLAQFSRLNVGVLFLLLLALVILADPLLRILYGDEFIVAKTSLQILAVGYWILSIKHLFVFYNASRNHPLRNIVAELIGLAVGIICNLLWVPSQGAKGAAMAFVLANFVAACVVVGQVLLKSKESSWDYFLPRGKDLPALKAALKKNQPITSEAPLN